MVTINTSTVAQENSERNRYKFYGLSIVTENDFFYPPGNNDDNYTGHFKFEFLIDDNKIENSYYSLYLNALAYTPPREAFLVREVVEEFRPYSSILEVGLMKTLWYGDGSDQFFKNNISYSGDISIGLFGDDLVGRGQNFIHTYITVKSDSVLGWPNQIGDPGKLSVNLRLSSIKQIANFEPITLAAKVDLNAGLFMNYLEIGSIIGNVPLSGIHHTVSIRALIREKRKFKIYMETYPSLRFVFQNSALTGYPFNDNSPYTISPKDINRVIPNISHMWVLQIPYKRNSYLDNTRYANLVYKINYRGKEFSLGEPYHMYGTLSLQLFW